MANPFRRRKKPKQLEVINIGNNDSAYNGYPVGSGHGGPINGVDTIVPPGMVGTPSGLYTGGGGHGGFTNNPQVASSVQRSVASVAPDGASPAVLSPGAVPPPVGDTVAAAPGPEVFANVLIGVDDKVANDGTGDGGSGRTLVPAYDPTADIRESHEQRLQETIAGGAPTEMVQPKDTSYLTNNNPVLKDAREQRLQETIAGTPTEMVQPGVANQGGPAGQFDVTVDQEEVDKIAQSVLDEETKRRQSVTTPGGVGGTSAGSTELGVSGDLVVFAHPESGPGKSHGYLPEIE